MTWMQYFIFAFPIIIGLVLIKLGERKFGLWIVFLVLLDLFTSFKGV